MICQRLEYDRGVFKVMAMMVMILMMILMMTIMNMMMVIMMKKSPCHL